MGKPKRRTPIPKDSLRVYTIKFDFGITDAEAEAYISKPNCETSKALRKYLMDVVKHVCKQIVKDSEEKAKEEQDK